MLARVYLKHRRTTVIPGIVEDLHEPLARSILLRSKHLDGPIWVSRLFIDQRAINVLAGNAGVDLVFAAHRTGPD